MQIHKQTNKRKKKKQKVDGSSDSEAFFADSLSLAQTSNNQPAYTGPDGKSSSSQK